MAYVGPPNQYDFMGATQFRLLSSLGLRSNHSLLDFGCGSLRAGKLILNYLDKSNYYGIEPNKWLIDDAIKNQIGQDIIEIKAPSFDFNDQFKTDVFSTKFDFIVAQSIFSHTGGDLIRIALKNFKDSLKKDGLILVTFVEGLSDFQGSGWIYPGCVSYRYSKIKEFGKDANLFISRIPWYHPRQTWYLLSRSKERIPNEKMMEYLKGVVLFEPDFNESWKKTYKTKGVIRLIKNSIHQTMPQPLKNFLKNIFKKTNIIRSLL